MTSTHPTALVASTAQRVGLPTVATGPSCSAPAWPDGPCPVCPRLAAEFEPYRQAGLGKRRPELAVAREAQLKAELESLRAHLRLREQQLFGTKSASPPAPSEAQPRPKSRQPRGQQPGQPGPARRDHGRRPAVEEIIDLPADRQRGSGCGWPCEPVPGTADGQILEVEVQAYRRVYRRRRYRPPCGCGQHPGLVTAAPPAKLIPKSTLGVSLWAEVLLDKYLFYRPTYRLLEEGKTHGLDLSLGTLTDGLHRLVPLFQPLYQALVEHNRKQVHWHADETRWLVFATVEGKVGQRWTLGVFHSQEAVVFVLDTGRAHDVPEDHLGPVAEGILSVDRYAASKAMKQVKDGRIVLAFCWAHVRRDFLGVARSWPGEEDWALGWVERIGLLYQGHEARLETRRAALAFAAKDGHRRLAVPEVARQAEAELADPGIPPARQKVLVSLQEPWDGLTVLVNHPEVPRDNTTAERVQRGPVVLRKNSYGSGAVGAGELAALLFSVFQTLCLWHINPRAGLSAYLPECAKAGGQAPGGLDPFLPWPRSLENRQEWSLEKDEEPADSSGRPEGPGRSRQEPPRCAGEEILNSPSLHPAHGFTEGLQRRLHKALMD